MVSLTQPIINTSQKMHQVMDRSCAHIKIYMCYCIMEMYKCKLKYVCNSANIRTYTCKAPVTHYVYVHHIYTNALYSVVYFYETRLHT